MRTAGHRYEPPQQVFTMARNCGEILGQGAADPPGDACHGDGREAIVSA